MGAIYAESAEDRPYGPGNPDYEYDGWCQRRDDDEAEALRMKEHEDAMSEFPPDNVLIARGKYSTLASEKRSLLKSMRNNLESISSCAGRVLRAPDDITFMREQAEMATALTASVLRDVAHAEFLQANLDILRPIAWGGKAEHEQ